MTARRPGGFPSQRLIFQRALRSELLQRDNGKVAALVCNSCLPQLVILRLLAAVAYIAVLAVAACGSIVLSAEDTHYFIMDSEQRAHAPSWDGNQDTWDEFREAVNIWMMAEDLEKSYSVAARLIMRLTGPAKTVVKSMGPAEIHPTLDSSPVKDETASDWKARRNREGIKKVMEQLNAKLGVTRPTQRGERLEEFFQTKSSIEDIVNASPTGACDMKSHLRG